VVNVFLYKLTPPTSPSKGEDYYYIFYPLLFKEGLGVVIIIPLQRGGIIYIFI